MLTTLLEEWKLQLLLAIGIPGAAMIILTLVKALSTHDFTNMDLADVGVDVDILAIGACGPIFTDATLHKTWGDAVTGFAILMALVGIVFLLMLALIRRSYLKAGRIRKTGAIGCVILGAVPLGVVVTLLLLGYKVL
jgi:hypothetical protein